MNVSIILHDNTGSYLLVQKGQSEHDSPYFLFCATKEGKYDSFSRRIYHQITGKQLDHSCESPLSIRYAIQDEDSVSLAYVVELINRRCTIPLTTDYCWTSINPTLMKLIADRYSPLFTQAINNIPAETLDNPSNDTVPLFAKRGFVKKIRRTIRSRLKQCGYRNIILVRQYYSTPTSSIFSIDVDFEIVFYKISEDGCPEALLTQTLGNLLPEYVLIPFGVDTEDNSFFTLCFGLTMGDVSTQSDEKNEREHPKQLMKPAIDLIAEFHQKASKHVEELKRLGMEDTSPQRMRNELPEFISELHERGILNEREAQDMRELAPRLVDTLDILADGKIPLTVCHGDLHDRNITLADEEEETPLLFDWYQATVSHPFLDLQGVLRESPWVEIYAEKWRSYDSSENIDDMLSTAEELRDMWTTFWMVKNMARRGYLLGQPQVWDICRDNMTRLIKCARCWDDVTERERST